MTFRGIPSGEVPVSSKKPPCGKTPEPDPETIATSNKIRCSRGFRSGCRRDHKACTRGSGWFGRRFRRGRSGSGLRGDVLTPKVLELSAKIGYQNFVVFQFVLKPPDVVFSRFQTVAVFTYQFVLVLDDLVLFFQFRFQRRNEIFRGILDHDCRLLLWIHGDAALVLVLHPACATAERRLNAFRKWFIAIETQWLHGRKTPLPAQLYHRKYTATRQFKSGFAHSARMLSTDDQRSRRAV